MLITRLNDDSSVEFYCYWMNSISAQCFFSLEGWGTAQVNISVPILKALPVPVPSPSEQTKIVSFLDRETSKIDELVGEQRRLIELLKEKRQAVISHAVTKGLNPNAPLKPSGIEWLGDVPEHWEVKKFQRCVDVAEGQVDPEDVTYSEMALIAPNHIESATGRLLGLESANEQGAESGKYLCRAGDVVYSKIRPALRKVCIAPVDCLCSADMYPLRSHSGLTNPFLFWLMLSEQFSALAVLESQRVAMPKINRESLKAVMFAIPPTTEQSAIADFLICETKQFDALTAEAQRGIELLQERRTALISAAVTGKIDVRLSETT
jgi:type I restriction enzyme S subunit